MRFIQSAYTGSVHGIESGKEQIYANEHGKCAEQKPAKTCRHGAMINITQELSLAAYRADIAITKVDGTLARLLIIAFSGHKYQPRTRAEYASIRLRLILPGVNL